MVSTMLTNQRAIPEVIGQQLELDDFYRPDCRLIFEAVVRAYYADERADPVVIGDKLRGPLASHWSCEEGEVADKLYTQANARANGDGATDHARLVKRHALNRRLLNLAHAVEQRIADGEDLPEEVGDFMATEAVKITAGSAKRAEILSMEDVGREFARYLQRLKLAREQGIELSVYTGHQFVDSWTKGLAPGELMFVGGPPGVGKSAATWEFATGFGRRQLLKDPEKRVGTFVLSLEMGLVGSSGRVATAMTKIEGDKIREGELTDDELSSIIKHWRNHLNLPIWWNFASNFRMSQMRALIVDAIRRHNVGLVVVDHFRMFDPDRRVNNANAEDEAKARFLKEDVAKDLNVAVVCLAHTVKMPRDSDPRPTLGDLRGSGQVAAHADIVAMMFRPWMHADEDDKLTGAVKPTDAELIFRKNRSGALGSSDFFFDPATMTIRDI